ncbi:Calcium-dependent protein kinase 8, partial [Durusdinium trenchii]
RRGAVSRRPGGPDHRGRLGGRTSGGAAAGGSGEEAAAAAGDLPRSAALLSGAGPGGPLRLHCPFALLLLSSGRAIPDERA